MDEMIGNVCVEQVFCSICLDYVTNNKASLNSCVHQFHYKCIKTWSKLKNCCPLCKKLFSKIKQPNNKTVKVRNRNILSANVNMTNFSSETNCQICKEGTEESQMLLCDDCDKGYHIFCLTPSLPDIPQGDWFCKKCVRKRERARKRRARNRNRRSRTAIQAAPQAQSMLFSQMVMDYFATRNVPLTQVQRDQAERNRLVAMCKLKTRRIKRVLGNRISEDLNDKLSKMPLENELSDLDYIQRLKAHKNFLDALELRLQRVTARIPLRH